MRVGDNSKECPHPLSFAELVKLGESLGVAMDELSTLGWGRPSYADLSNSLTKIRKNLNRAAKLADSLEMSIRMAEAESK